MNTRKVVAIWHHEGSEYQVPRVNSNFHRELIEHERPWRSGLQPLDIAQVRRKFRHSKYVCSPDPGAAAVQGQACPLQIIHGRYPVVFAHDLQPEGPSWEIDGHHVRWQQWDLRVGFNYREGLVLHQIG